MQKLSLKETDQATEFTGDRTAYTYDPRGEPHGGYHGPQSLEQFVKWGRGWVRRDRHLPIGIVGPPGNGKSSFRTLLAKKLDEEYDPEEQTTVGELNTVRLAKTVGRYRVACGDEGDASGNKLATMRREAVQVAEEMDHIRKLNTIPIFTRPDYADFIGGLADHLAWVFELPSRGRFRAFECFSLGMKKKTTLLVERFNNTDDPRAPAIPPCSEVWPEGWEAVLRLGDDYARDVDPQLTQLRREQLDRARRLIRAVVR